MRPVAIFCTRPVVRLVVQQPYAHRLCVTVTLDMGTPLIVRQRHGSPTAPSSAPAHGAASFDVVLTLSGLRAVARFLAELPA